MSLSFHNLKRYFLFSLGIIISVIGISEIAVMLLLDKLRQYIALPPLQNSILDTALLTLITAPILWFLVLRPLCLQILQQQKEVETQAETNKELLQALENHVLVSITDIHGQIIYANDMFCKVSGYTQDELLGQDHRLVNSGYHSGAYIRDMWRTIASGQVWHGEFCNRSKNGLLYWVDSTIAPVLNDTGKPKQYISIRRDITVGKANELKLTALKLALDASSEMILITDASGQIQYANPALCRFTHWPETELLGQKPYVLDSPISDRKALVEMQKCLQLGQAWSGRLRGRRRGINAAIAEQETLDYWAKTNITPILTESGELSGYVQIQHDVSKQVEEEATLQIEKDDTAARLAVAKALHQSVPLKQRYLQVLDILANLKSCDSQQRGDVLLRVQEEGSEQFEVFGGSARLKDTATIIEAEQLLAYGGGLCRQVLSSTDAIVAENCRCFGQTSHGHYLVPIASGIETLGVLLLYTGPNPVRTEFRLTMLKQVGEMIALAYLQHQANASLETARDAALQVAQTKTEFLANMSHEIRTPMNGVLGMLDLLKDTQLSREQWDLIEIATNSAESLLTIINDILDFSKLEAGKIELEQIEFNLPDLVEEVCALLSSRAHGKGLELNCFLPANLPLRWQGDPTRLRQVLTNLIGNAVKFTETGEVSVKVTASDNESGLLFEVKDTGIGISTDAQIRLFQAFSQADSSTSRRYGGTGLGLSISKDLVELMNGKIGVDSVSGEGSNFWFTLPLIRIDRDAPVLQANFSDKRALIVDDNATNRMILNHYLSSWGFTLSEAENGPAALAELEAAVQRNQPYDLLLSDMQMPDMDGFALARAITEKPAIAKIPRILLSSGSIGSESERLASGFAQSLLKPVRQSQLYDAIIAALEMPSPKVSPAIRTKETMPDYSGKQVLVVEDNKVNQKVILSQLAKFGLQPDLADNGQEALLLLESNDYDLIFMDCQMPIMDGYEAARAIRARESDASGRDRLSGKHTLITALTAHASFGEREKCLNAGMDDYLSKPVSRADLAKVLTRWLGPSLSGHAPIDRDQSRHDSNGKPEPIAPTVKETVPVNDCWDIEAALARLDDDAELLEEMIDLFLTEVPVQLEEINTSLSRADLPALADAAHAVKGMAGHFCAEKLFGLAVNLERAARHERTGDFQTMTDDLTRSMSELAKNLRLRKEQTQ